MLRQVDPLSAMKAGLLGTVVMTIVMYALPLIGIPPMDIMAALGSVLPFDFSPYIPGSLIHLATGIVLAFVYAAIFYSWLPGPGWLRGALFSLLPWLFAITLLGPSLQLASRILGTASSGTGNPCAVANPCAPKAKNPCAPKAAANPCAPAAANPCAAGGASRGIPPQVLSLFVHLIYGGAVGTLYRPRA